MSSNFAEFGDDLFNSDESESQPYDKYMTVLGLLQTHYGRERGNEIFALLERTAKAATKDMRYPSTPGILFNEDGGEFVGFDTQDEDEEDEFSETDYGEEF